MKWIKYLSFLVISLFWGSAYLHAENVDELFSQANEAYYKNQLEKADQLYHKILNEGVESGHLYYNLGNLSYHQGKTGQTIYYYEKALRLIPRDSDLRANLKFAQQKRLDDFKEVSVLENIENRFFFWTSYLTLKEALFIMVVINAIFWMSLLVTILNQRPLFKKGAIVLFILLIVFGLSLCSKLNNELFKQWAIIVLPEVEVRPTFLESDKTLMTLHEGTKVRVLLNQDFQDENKQWVQIALPHGQRGWVPATEVGLL